MTRMLRSAIILAFLFTTCSPWRNSAIMVSAEEINISMINQQTGAPISLWFFDRFGFRENGRFSINATASFAAMTGYSMSSASRAVAQDIPLFYLSVCTKKQYNHLIETISAAQQRSLSAGYCTSEFYNPPVRARDDDDDEEEDAGTLKPTSEPGEASPATSAPAHGTSSSINERMDYWRSNATDSGCQLIPFVNSTIDYTTLRYRATAIAQVEVLVTEELFFGVTNCEAATDSQYWSSVQLDIKYLFLNPGNSRLSTEDEPRVPMNFVLAVSWVVLSVLWLGAILFVRRRVNMSLHWVMAAYPITKSGVMLQTYFRWQLLSWGQTESQTESFMVPTFVLSRATYYLAFGTALLLLGKGWKLTRDNLHPMERRNITLLVAIYTVTTFTLALWQRYRTNATGFLSFAFLAMAYVLVLYSVWFSCTQQMMALKIHLRVIELFGINPTSTPQHDILNMLTRFRALYFGYLFTAAVFDIVLVAVVQNYPWAKACVSETLEILAAIGVGITFRPRIIKVELAHLNQTNMTVEPPSAGASVAGGMRDNAPNAASAGLRNWREGDPLPRNPREDLLFTTSSRREILPRDNSIKPDHTTGVQMITITNPGEIHPTALGRQVQHLPPIAQPAGQRMPPFVAGTAPHGAEAETSTTAPRQDNEASPANASDANGRIVEQV